MNWSRIGIRLEDRDGLTDWQIGPILALYWWIGDGLADWSRIGESLADWSRIGIGLADR